MKKIFVILKNVRTFAPDLIIEINVAEEQIIIRPHEGFQRAFARTNVNVCFSGGMLGGGKTFGAALATAEPILDPNWRGLVVKNNIDDLKRGGGVIDTFNKELYGEWTSLRMSEMPRLTSPYGSWIDFGHLADQSVDAILRRFKSSQYDWIYFDELTGFTWDAFKTLLTRNRGKSKFPGKCLATTNPERESWIRKFIDWYIGEDVYAELSDEKAWENAKSLYAWLTEAEVTNKYPKKNRRKFRIVA